jgi:hypothetical protein
MHEFDMRYGFQQFDTDNDPNGVPSFRWLWFEFWCGR